MIYRNHPYLDGRPRRQEGRLLPASWRASLGGALALVLLPLSAAVARAQEQDTASATFPKAPGDTTATLVGTVASAQTGNTVQRARVILPGIARGAMTDEEGKFRITDLPPGLYKAKVAYFDYSTNQRPVRLERGKITRVTFLLDRNVLEVAELKVEAERREPRDREMQGFYRRQKRGFGLFITREDIEKRNPQRTSDMFRGLPSVYVAPTRFDRSQVFIGRAVDRCRPDLWIDGSLTKSYYVDDIDPDAVKAIEVYRRTSETPPEYTRTNTGCGTILIWTDPRPSAP